MCCSFEHLRRINEHTVVIDDDGDKTQQNYLQLVLCQEVCEAPEGINLINSLRPQTCDLLGFLGTLSANKEQNGVSHFQMMAFEPTKVQATGNDLRTSDRVKP